MNQFLLLATLLVLIAGVCQGQIDLGTNNIRYIATPGGLGRDPIIKNGSFQKPRFSPDGKYLLVSGRDSTLHLFDVETGTQLWESDSLAHASGLYNVAWSPDGKTIVATGRFYSEYDTITELTTQYPVIEFIDPSTGKTTKETRLTALANKAITLLRYIEDGKYIFGIEGGEGSFSPIYFDPMTGEIIKRYPHVTFIGYFDFNDTYSLLITNTRKIGEVVVYNTSDWSLAKAMQVGDKAMRYLTFLPQTSYFLAVPALTNQKPVFYLVDTVSGEIVRTFSEHAVRITETEVIPDNNYFLSIHSSPYTLGRNVVLWDVNKENPIMEWYSPLPLQKISVSPDGKYVAATADSDSICLWEMPQLSDAPETGEKKFVTGGISCYPNPTGTRVKISWEIPIKDRLRISIVNVVGEEMEIVYEGSERQGIQEVNVSGIASGQYLVVMQSGQRRWVEPLLIVR